MWLAVASVWMHKHPSALLPFFSACASEAGSTVVQWLALSPHSKRVLGLHPPADWGPSVWCLHALLVPARVFSRYSGFLPHQHVNIFIASMLTLAFSSKHSLSAASMAVDSWSCFVIAKCNYSQLHTLEEKVSQQSVCWFTDRFTNHVSWSFG